MERKRPQRKTLHRVTHSADPELERVFQEPAESRALEFDEK